MRRTLLATLMLVTATVLPLSREATVQAQPSADQLPRAFEIPGVKPEVLARTEVPNVPGRLLIVSRTTYQPGAKVRKHYHTSEVTFYILEGGMTVQDEGKEPVTLKPGDFLLITPGTVHWNASASAPLVFLEHVIVDQNQRSAVFME